MLDNKTIVLGVTGGIAAYKSVDLVSRLRKLGANIHVIMTESATKFVTPLTFQTLSKNVVAVDTFQNIQYWEVEHISLAQKADLFIIAPATANIIGKVANGIADDMLSTTIMATKADKLIVPAMNTQMYLNPIVQNNIKKLQKLGYRIIKPDCGFLACGDIGIGKFPSLAVIEEEVLNCFNKKKDLIGKKILITAGPTCEPIDPVRFITNHSTGKMGYAIAQEAVERGAEVILISGPTSLEVPVGAQVEFITSTEEMYDKVMEYISSVDIIIKSAAVSDYRPKKVFKEKIKKTQRELILTLEKNKDIAYELGKIKGNKILVGFAAETQNLIDNAKAKIKKKNLDFIVANDLTQEGAGFKGDTNIVKIIDKKGNIRNLPKMSKKEVAKEILDEVVKIM
ncbi:bifunctional phosphopantothenoylcysteine decarboxylase/phosphopantothenate--cysteine ligase CoaBC [Garciella nitratireducens]|uniref:Coenzyme A biosynthesis bifunctional protein CoaBC n=1 Tax=Garciella nitratireducens DSM 15102 TaxID=1121911 RepID=A0A1T4JZ46_9FIRM|nr:bifunctional phosphopantothenoylcysteine decarboxylase/phosphopantothenate--cysteine ligase CoaBC [Garciella nitratireducens]SJZ35522.1 phosphopantothenoylcysteine decarboxylase / phosphopantothenate--cysteine ligase [Garciella nitratireducens DSM 15102]